MKAEDSGASSAEAAREAFELKFSTEGYVDEVDIVLVDERRGKGPTAEIVYQHHERCDGSGYPRGLRRRNNCFSARRC